MRLSHLLPPKAFCLVLLSVGVKTVLSQPSKFFIVYPDATPLTPLNPSDQIEVGNFDITIETPAAVAEVNFSISTISDLPADPPHVMTTGAFFDLPSSSSISSTPGLYTLMATTYDGTGSLLENLSVQFQVIPGPTPSPSSSPPFEPIRIACGVGGPFSDSFGNFWMADMYFNGGGVYTTGASIGGTDLDILYQSERWSGGGFTLEYNIPVPGATQVDVVIHLCELFWTTAGSRVFDIKIQGTVVMTNVEPMKIAGAPKYAAILSFPAVAVSGVVNIAFINVVDNANPVGIEVLPAGTGPPVQPLKVFINCGATLDYTDVFSQKWGTDRYVSGGTMSSTTNAITDTSDPGLFKTYRLGLSFAYSVPVFQDGEYKVVMYFVDPVCEQSDCRIFDILIEGQTVTSSFNIYAQAGAKNKALTVDFNAVVDDGELNVVFVSIIGQAIVSGIIIELKGPHYSHSVPGGPYTVVDVDGSGAENVAVDGSQSHTHFPDASLVQWTWSESGLVLASGEQAILAGLSVGSHIINLYVEDDVGNMHNEVTSVSVFPQGYPVLNAVNPNSGAIGGGEAVTLTGSGFLNNPVTVKFGNTPALILNVVSDTQMLVSVPASAIAVPVQVILTNNAGTSNAVTYTYIGACPIQFIHGNVGGLGSSSTLAFGPDGNLYIGTTSGTVVKWTLDDDYNVISEVASTAINDNSPGYRTILGILVDPFEVNYVTVYVSHAQLFHGSQSATSGLGINGAVSKLTGANLENHEFVIQNLPVSDHDHSVNGLEMDADRNLYIQVGGNTNAGVPGELANDQPDNYFSSALLIAHLQAENFNGVIQYDVNGIPIGTDVEVYASGERNPYDIVLHSNGNLYGTDNGPNYGYGDESTGCTTQKTDPNGPDELNILKKGIFYGHANRKFGNCDWRGHNEAADTNCPPDKKDCYKPPMVTLPSSTNGIVEFRSNHFSGEMRGDLIVGKFKGALTRIILSSDGEQVVAKPPPQLVPQGGLDVTQGPDGTLFVARYDLGIIDYHKPIECSSSGAGMKLLSVWPYRGPMQGNHKLTLYGLNFQGSGTLEVKVGGQPCQVITSSATKIECTVPSGAAGKVDITVTNGSTGSILTDAYERMAGGVAGTAPPTVSPSKSPSASPSVSVAPSLSKAPSANPSVSLAPSAAPTRLPTTKPSASSPPLPFSTIYINCGGTAYTDSVGNVWSADQHFIDPIGGTFSVTNGIAGTVNDKLYQTERFAYGSGPVKYLIPVNSGGTYVVTLHFAEIYFNASGKRLIDIWIQGINKLNGLDIWVAAGGKFKPYDLTYTGIMAPEGTIAIDLISAADNAKISAIKIGV